MVCLPKVKGRLLIGVTAMEVAARRLALSVKRLAVEIMPVKTPAELMAKAKRILAA